MRWLLSKRSPQLRAAFEWLRQNVGEADPIEIEKGGQRETVEFSLPARPGAFPKKAKYTREARFLVRLQPDKSMSEKVGWRKHFASPMIEVWERFGAPKVNGIRFGLSEDEKKELVETARSFISRHIAGESTIIESSRTPGRLFSKADVGVALWVRGRMRGSSVVTGMPLVQGVARAAIRASRDQRFKPIEGREVNEMHIEIMVLHPLRIPLSREEVKKNEIYPEKGYEIQFATKRGWLLPEVHNVRNHASLEEFVKTLAYEKAGIRGAIHSANIYLFEVEDWISFGDDIRILVGPVQKKKASSLSDGYKNMAQASARWLGGIQGADGSIPPYIDPWRRTNASIDWVRCAFIAWTLAEWGATMQDEEALQCSRRAFEYLDTYIADQWLELNSSALFLAYFGQCARALRYWNEASDVANQIRTKHLPDVISASQAASFMRLLGEEPLLDVERVLKNEFIQMQDKPSTELAAYAELINLFHYSDPSFARSVAEWLVGLQRVDGSFPRSAHSSFYYSRGVAKITESLATYPDVYPEALERALSWLTPLQYDDENTFFLRDDERKKMIGGFRHDGMNAGAWSDTAGHILLTAARLQKSKN